MKTPSSLLGCACCALNRRSFMAKTGAATLGALGTLSSASWLEAAGATEKTRIRVIYALHTEKQDRPDWPNKGFDFKPAMERITHELERRCKGFEFVTSLAAGEEEAKKIIESDKAVAGIDGYIVYQMNCWNRVVQTVATTGKPVLYADFQFGGSGGFLVYNAGFLRSQTPNVAFVASSRTGDLVEAVKCFAQAKRSGSAMDFVNAVNQARTKATPRSGKLAGKRDDVRCLSTHEGLARLKQTRLLAIRGQESGPAGEVAGIQIQHVPFAELNEAWNNADKDHARAVADTWEKTAKKVDGVSRETLESSAAMYLAEKELLKKHGAMGITINCLGGFYGGHIHAYPCLGFHQLNNEGLIGGCECDVRSAATMVIGTTLTQGRPGYISDPVIDTSKNQIIYAHCVAANRAFGPEGRANPYHILTHSEDRQGASMRSLLPAGYLTTTLEINPTQRRVLIHRAKTIGNNPSDLACRTKLEAVVRGDLEKLTEHWSMGWHRVTFYGDLQPQVQELCAQLKLQLIEEA